jgi:hypothetical protein
MSDLPFAVSPEAAAHIRVVLREGRKHRDVRGMLPVLIYAFNSRTTDNEGRTLQWCRAGFFEVGWYNPDKVAEYALEEINLGDELVYALEGAVERLVGKTLVLETVEVGYPEPSATKVQHLSAQ